MITVDEAKGLINNSIENYNQRKVDIQDKTKMVIENNIYSTENTALLSVSYILQGYKTDSQKSNEQITSAIKERYDQKVTSKHYQVSSLRYLFPLDTLITKPFKSLMRIQNLVIKAASAFIFRLGGRRLMLDVKCSSITNSIGYEGMEPAWAVSTGFGTDETKFLIPRVTNHNIKMENKRKESLQNPNPILCEQDYYFLQRCPRGGRQILTNMSGCRSHPLTRNLLKRFSQAVNCLKKTNPMEDSPEKKTLGMTVWRQVRIITSLVVAVDRTNTSEAKILKNNSELSYWTT